MKSSELVAKFNLSDNIDYSELGHKITEYLGSDLPNKVDTIMELLAMVVELNWELYQYNELLHSKKYSELYSMIVSTFALNPSLGKVPSELTQLDIKLRRETNSDKIRKIIDGTFIPVILNLLLRFNLDIGVLKVLDVIMVTREVCIKYHKKVKLTLDIEKFKRIKAQYRDEINYFGFTSMFTEDELKKAYRKKALIVHPDRESGSQAEFVKCLEAYHKLLKIFE